MDKLTIKYNLDLIGHIKQYLDEFKSSMFHKADEIETIIKKHGKGEELDVDELIALVDYRFRMKFKENILEKESLILHDESKDIQEFIYNDYNEMGLYLLYESYYVMKFLEEAPEIIERAISLKKIFINQYPSQRVKSFCNEAYLSHISGHYIASAVLARSIVETILFDKFQIDRCRLWELNDAAKEGGIYDDNIWGKIDFIRLEINNILHNIIKEKTSEEKNREIIKVTQEILEYLLNDEFRISMHDKSKINKIIEKRREERKKKKGKIINP
jgi:hypothetical protein